jgi:hypothetical protein
MRDIQFRQSGRILSQSLVLTRINYFVGGTVNIAPGAPSLIHSITPAEVGSRRSGQTRCASCRSERERSVPRGIRRRYAHRRISARPRQFGRCDGSGGRNCRTKRPVVLFEMSCWTYRRHRESLLLSASPRRAQPVTTWSTVWNYAAANCGRKHGPIESVVARQLGHGRQALLRRQAASSTNLTLETMVAASQRWSPSARLKGRP